MTYPNVFLAVRRLTCGGGGGGGGLDPGDLLDASDHEGGAERAGGGDSDKVNCAFGCRGEGHRSCSYQEGVSHSPARGVA